MCRTVWLAEVWTQLLPLLEQSELQQSAADGRDKLQQQGACRGVAWRQAHRLLFGQVRARQECHGLGFWQSDSLAAGKESFELNQKTKRSRTQLATDLQ